LLSGRSSSFEQAPSFYEPLIGQRFVTLRFFIQQRRNNILAVLGSATNLLSAQVHSKALNNLRITL